MKTEAGRSRDAPTGQPVLFVLMLDKRRGLALGLTVDGQGLGWNTAGFIVGSERCGGRVEAFCLIPRDAEADEMTHLRPIERMLIGHTNFPVGCSSL